LDVHGTVVSGPLFPAQIWHAYMGTAVGNRPDVSFPPAQTQPVFTSWRGQWEFGGAYGLTTTTTSTDTTPAPPAPREQSTTHATTTQQSPPTTTVAPGTTTTAPPPPPPPTETTVAP